MTRQKLTRLTGSGNGECSQNDCPNIYRDETDGGIVVQGDICEAFQPPRIALAESVPFEEYVKGLDV
ncbi:hypothetical protein [Streptomyces malaysiensis]|uniref:hypothetical protein n=1 Tax=Streptomyces malaysiensis TaxID=92644 RepID=UPI0037240F70